MKYYKLLDTLNYGEVVKSEGRKQYTYRFGAEKWVRNGIMLFYQWPDDERYEKYSIITEKKAFELIDEQRKALNELLELAKTVAVKAHEGQLDKGGSPYINHPVAVAAALESTEHKIVALLHDVCEDSSVTTTELLTMGFTKRIVNSVSILTKRDNENYEDYLAKVKQDSNAWHVKIADIEHNMDIARIPDPSEKDSKRIEKYKKALEFLKS